jgi:hypothetical protein
MDTLNISDSIAIITVATLIAILKDQLMADALNSFIPNGSQRRRYTPEEDALILSGLIKDSDIELIIQRTKNSIQVRRNSLKHSKA